MSVSREEPHVVAALVALCKQMDVRCVVQVGAGDGYEAEEIAKATGARAVAIDADSGIRFVEGVEAYVAVIGADNRPSVPFYFSSTPGLSTLFSRGANEECVHMPMRRLDSFCALWNIVPDVLIIDVEGATVDVLEGAGHLLDGVKLIYAEVNSVPIRPGIRTVDAVDDILLPLGFTHHRALPSYDGGAQSNLTYLRMGDK